LDARGDVARAIDAEPGSAVARVAAARILLVTRAFHEAFFHIEQAMRLSPRTAETGLSLRFEAASRLGRRGEALRPASQAAALQPHRPVWHALGARLLVLRRDYEGALVWTQRALAIEPGSPRLRLELAGLLRHLGRQSEARVEAEQAIQLA